MVRYESLGRFRDPQGCSRCVPRRQSAHQSCIAQPDRRNARQIDVLDDSAVGVAEARTLHRETLCLEARRLQQRSSERRWILIVPDNPEGRCLQNRSWTSASRRGCRGNNAAPQSGPAQHDSAPINSPSFSIVPKKVRTQSRAEAKSASMFLKDALPITSPRASS